MTTPNIPGAAPTPTKTGRKTADQQPKRDHRAAVQARTHPGEEWSENRRSTAETRPSGRGAGA